MLRDIFSPDKIKWKKIATELFFFSVKGEEAQSKKAMVAPTIFSGCVSNIQKATEQRRLKIVIMAFMASQLLAFNRLSAAQLPPLFSTKELKKD